MSSFISRLETICETLGDEVPNANYGGCGFVAKAFAQKLIPILGEENVKIRYTLDEDSNSLTTLRNNYKLTKKFFNNCDPYDYHIGSLNSHIVCTIKYKNTWYVLEANCFTKGLKNYEHKLSKDSFTLSELNNFLSNKSLWNNIYNRANNKKIYAIINQL